MISKIFRSTVFAAMIVLLCSLTMIMGVLYGYADDVQAMQLRDELSLAAIGVEEYGTGYLQKVESSRFRLTLVSPDGAVLYDTHAHAALMENHAGREEIREALRFGTGSAVRSSDTLLERRVYEAKRLSDGNILRISVTQQTMLVLVVGMLHPLCVVIGIAIVLSAVLAQRMSRKIMEPINSINLEHPLENETYEELSPLLKRIHQQHGQIAAQLRSIQRKADEFEQIILGMQEGLVLLDKEQTVLSINPAAMALFHVNGGCVGSSFCTVDRQRALASAIEAAFASGRQESRMERGGREYQILCNRIESGEKVMGLVILAVDITDAYHAERNRREFSANVSHELKTPLQGIIGSAELLENGLVKPEDQQRFIGHIRREASRLVSLIEDVIRLSHLDEGLEIPREDLDLLALAEEIGESLQIAADKEGVTLSVSGEPCTVHAVPGLVCEIIQNLASNAIKYNVPGGTVEITVKQVQNHAVLTVADTGIGIPPEYQSRVFERFFRVDKSHSKQSGGTGLGLSIVKHAVQYLGARLSLQSAPGAGTTVSVTF